MIRQLIQVSACVGLILLVCAIGPAQKPELVVQTGHSKGVLSVAFSPDGMTIASGSGDNTVKLWEVSTGTELRTFKGQSDSVMSVAFSPDGKIVASGSNDGTVKLWNVTTGVEIRTLKGQVDVSSVAFSPDGRTLASGGDGIRLWDVATGSQLRPLAGHPELVRSTALAFSSNGKILASGGYDAVRLWDLLSGSELHTLTGHSKPINSVAFSPDGKILASGSDDHTIKLWDVASGVQLHTLAGHSDSITSVAFSPDGKTLVSGNRDKTVKLWDVSDAVVLRTLVSDEFEIVSVAFSPNGMILATVSSDTVKLLNFSTGAELRSLKGNFNWVESLAISPNGRILANVVGFTSGVISLWDLSTGNELLAPAGSGATSLAFSPDGKILAYGSLDLSVSLWDIEKGVEIRALEGHTNVVNSIDFSPDGKSLASASDDGTVKLWQVSTGTVLHTFRSQSDSVESVAFRTGGDVVASGNADGSIELWNVATGRRWLTLLGHSKVVESLAFSRDGKTLVSGSGDSTVRFWQVATGTELRTLPGRDTPVNAVAFSPDGQIVVNANDDGTIEFWDSSTGKKLRTLPAHSDYVNALSFSPNGKYLVSGSADSTIKIWEAATGKELVSLITFVESSLFSDLRNWIAVTPDGFFDGSPAAWNKVIWRFGNNTFNYSLIEAAFSDFYFPGLLAELLNGRPPVALVDFSKKDRRQPRLKLALADSRIDMTITSRDVKVRIAVSEAPAGARDVRLFRNGALVKVWPGDVLKGQGSVNLEVTIAMVAGENKLTAYAFNHDNIKSTDTELIITGDGRFRRGTLYVLAVGVGEYANPEFDLEYTPADATDFANEIRRNQELLQRGLAGSEFDQVKVVTLLSQNATKANILSALGRLSGMGIEKLPEGSLPMLREFQPAQPEDGVIVYFSGHGTAQGDHFYLIPHDIGYLGPRRDALGQGLPTILAHSISDVELELAFRDIDAGRMFMIIDACNSGQALENKDEPRRGPMNTRGLAQLAYEKGMYIMTASQNVEEAFVSEKLKHSYLTYALVEEGLKTKAADADHNGEVVLREWFDYALTRVPKLREETLQSKSLEEVNPAKKAAVKNQKSQTPRVFYRREPEAQPMIVATIH